MPEILMSDLQCTLSPVNEANVVQDVYKTASITIADKGLLYLLQNTFIVQLIVLTSIL